MLCICLNLNISGSSQQNRSNKTPNWNFQINSNKYVIYMLSLKYSWQCRAYRVSNTAWNATFFLGKKGLYCYWQTALFIYNTAYKNIKKQCNLSSKIVINIQNVWVIEHVWKLFHVIVCSINEVKSCFCLQKQMHFSLEQCCISSSVSYKHLLL